MSSLRGDGLWLALCLCALTPAARAADMADVLAHAPVLASWQDEGDEEEYGYEEESSDEEEFADEEAADEADSVDDEEPTDETESVDAQDADESVSEEEEEESAEESAPEEVASEEAPAASQSDVNVERWSVTMHSPMGTRHLDLTIERSAGGAFTISGDGYDGPASASEIAGTKLSWSWDVTNPMPMKFNCDGIIEGDTMSGNCKLGMFGNVAMSGSRK